MRLAHNPLARRWGTLGAVILVLAAWGHVFPAPAADSTGIAAAAHRLLPLGLVCATLVLALGLGTWMLRRLGPSDLTGFDLAWLGTVAGLFSLAYGLTGLGLMGWMTPPAVLMSMVVVGLFAWPDPAGVWRESKDARVRFAKGWNHASALTKAAVILGGVIAATAVLRAMAPAAGYDALAYHLEAPRLFLREGRIFPSTGRWMLNLPLAPEMLSVVGLSSKARDYSQLLELAWAGLLLWGTWGLASRWLGTSAAALAVGILLTMPVLPVWASLGNSDFARAAVLLAGLACLLRVSPPSGIRWAVWGGVFTGFALGSKYQSAAGLVAFYVVLVPLVLKAKWKFALEASVAFSLAALLVASPWYLKNLIWFGDAVFPLGGSGLRIDSGRMAQQAAFAATWPAPNSLRQWLSLPLDFYLHPEKYSEILPALSFPSPYFPLLALYPVLPKAKSMGRALGATWIHGVLIAAVSPVLRWFLPLFPIAAMASGYALDNVRSRRPSVALLQRVVVVLLVLQIAVTAAINVGLVVGDGVVPTLLGLQSEATYLAHVVPTYGATAYAREHLPPGSRLVATGDMRTYYCDNLCLGTDDQFLWKRLVERSQTSEGFARAARDLGATHVLVSWQDLEYFRDHGPVPGAWAAALDLTTRILPACGERVYSDSRAEIYALTCSAPSP